MTSLPVRILSGGALGLVFVFGAAAQARKTIADGVYSEEQARRGAAIYAEHCSSCHAPDLTGLDQAPPLAGGEFVADWNTLSMNDLFERTRVSMPADKPGTLSRAQMADVLAFVLQKNNMPAGQNDLSESAADLQTIMFVGKKP